MSSTSGSKRISASAPGSLMLMGEHAVLNRYRALCAAVNQRIRVEATPRSDRELSIASDLGSHRGAIDDIRAVRPFQFILEALRQFAPPSGLDVTVKAEFSSTVGFGSSAAVTVATLAVVQAMHGQVPDRDTLLRQAIQVIRSVQGNASGADAAAAVFGGLVGFRSEPLKVAPLAVELPLTAVYAGYKTPTPEVIKAVAAFQSAHPDTAARIFREMDGLVEQALTALWEQNLKKLGDLFNQHHQLQAELGCSDSTLEHLVQRLRENPEVCGAKISGSGLGDCVIALGTTEAQVDGYTSFPAILSPQGVTLDD